MAELSAGLRETEARVRGRAIDLAAALRDRIGQGAPLTEIGDRVATSLQTPRRTAGFDAGALS